tara:strand:- start:317 stop:721 length:405 start_codon:yes stop_codon:yes gene_type:complete
MDAIKIVAGVILGFFAVMFFWGAITLEQPYGGPAHNFGYNIGKNIPWILCALGSYFLLKGMSPSSKKPVIQNQDSINESSTRDDSNNKNSNNENSTVDELKKWAELKESGAITEDEYQQKKSEILKSGGTTNDK